MRLVCQLFRRRNRQLSPQECYVGQTAYTRRMVGYDNHQRKTMYGRSMLTVFTVTSEGSMPQHRLTWVYLSVTRWHQMEPLINRVDQYPDQPLYLTAFAVFEGSKELCGTL